MSSTVEITSENFQQYLDEKDGIFVLDVWAPWCAPCRAFGPIFEAVAEKNTDITWGKLDSQGQPALAQAMRIQSIPTLMVFRDGILVFRESGMLPEAALSQLVEQVRALDMDAVRKEIEKAGDDSAQTEA